MKIIFDRISPDEDCVGFVLSPVFGLWKYFGADYKFKYSIKIAWLFWCFHVLWCKKQHL